MNNSSSIKRILVIDDNASVRESYTFPIEAAEREAVMREDALGSLASFLNLPLQADAAVSDYQLSPGNYAFFDGAALVSEWYKRRFPAILCTQFDKANDAKFRVLRRWMPIVMRPADLDQDSLMHGLELVQREFREVFVPARRPWRALVHFVEYSEDENFANAKVPGWGEEVVALRTNDLPNDVRAGIRASIGREEEFRCYATANLGAETNEELYLSDWEVSGK